MWVHKCAGRVCGEVECGSPTDRIAVGFLRGEARSNSMFRGYSRPTLHSGFDGPGGSQAQRPALPFRWPEGRSPPRDQELAPARGHGGAIKSLSKRTGG